MFSLCRACLVLLKKDVCYNLLIERDLAIKFMEVTTLTVDIYDDFPKLLCKNCYEMVIKFYNFQKMCAESLKNFTEYMEEQLETFEELTKNNAIEVFNGTTEEIYKDELKRNGEICCELKEMQKQNETIFKQLKFELNIQKKRKEEEEIKKKNINENHNDDDNDNNNIDSDSDSNSDIDIDSDNDDEFGEKNEIENEAEVEAAAEVAEDINKILTKNINVFAEEKFKNETTKESLNSFNNNNSKKQQQQQQNNIKQKLYQIESIENVENTQKMPTTSANENLKKYKNKNKNKNFNANEYKNYYNKSKKTKTFEEKYELKKDEEIFNDLEEVYIVITATENLNVIETAVAEVDEKEDDQNKVEQIGNEAKVESEENTEKEKFEKELTTEKNIKATKDTTLKNVPNNFKSTSSSSSSATSTTTTTITTTLSSLSSNSLTSTKNKKTTKCGTAIKSNELQCKICFKKFYKIERLECHRRIHQGLKPYYCTICTKDFTRADSLDGHIKECHTFEATRTCSYKGCTNTYSSLRALKYHIKRFHILQGTSPPADFVCEICGKGFTRKIFLKRHGFTHMDKSEYPYACEYCDKRFYEKITLRDHINRHAGIKKFKCTICGQLKSTKSELRLHINCHTNERTWACLVCGKIFNNNTNLRLHCAAVHENARDYVCRFCEQRFAKLGTLQNHEMRHTGERPHKCNLCDQAFLQKSALNKHMQGKHKQINSNKKDIMLKLNKNEA